MAQDGSRAIASPSPSKVGPGAPITRKPALFFVPAVAVLAGLLAAYALNPTSHQSTPALLPVAVADLASAQTTLDPNSASQAVDDAKACKAPLASLVLASSDPAGADIRIQSGGYVSPLFHVTRDPIRVAVPFPAPYMSGAGTISVLGSAGSVDVSMSPTWHVEVLGGATARNVVWATNSPCT